MSRDFLGGGGRRARKPSQSHVSPKNAHARASTPHPRTPTPRSRLAFERHRLEQHAHDPGQRARASPPMSLGPRAEDLQGLLPPKWCPQTLYPRPSTAPAGRNRPAKTGSRSRPKPRQAPLNPPTVKIENAGFSGSLGWQRSRWRGSCVPCTPTCGMTTDERVSKGSERARVAVRTGAGKSGNSPKGREIGSAGEEA